MTLNELENLAHIGKLKREAATSREIDGLLNSARERLRDAASDSLTYSSRFDLAYNASHALALCALRRKGYRSDNRYLVFQALPHTAGLPVTAWRVLAKAHERRNLAEYEGHLEQDQTLLREVIAAARQLLVIIESMASGNNR